MVALERFRIHDEFANLAGSPGVRSRAAAFDAGDTAAFDDLPAMMAGWVDLPPYDGPDLASHLANLRRGGLFVREKA